MMKYMKFVKEQTIYLIANLYKSNIRERRLTMKTAIAVIAITAIGAGIIAKKSKKKAN